MDELISYFANAPTTHQGAMIALALIIPMTVLTLLALNAAFRQMGMKNPYVRVFLALVVGSFILPLIYILVLKVVPLPAMIAVGEALTVDGELGLDFDWQERLLPILMGLVSSSSLWLAL